MQPRGIRISQAHTYLGIGRKVFDTHVRPKLTLIEWAPKTITVDRLELDAVWEDTKSRIGRPASAQRRTEPWDDQPRPDSTSAVESGTSTSALRGTEDFAAALAKAKAIAAPALLADLSIPFVISAAANHIL